MGWRLLKSYVRGPLTQEKPGYRRLFKMHPDHPRHFKLKPWEEFNRIFTIEPNNLNPEGAPPLSTGVP